jgi:hypothetical protein
LPSDGLTAIARWRVVVISALLGLVTVVIMTPRLLCPNFGLLDDGVTIEVARRIVGQGDALLPFTLEVHRGRFRPWYWVHNALQYALWGPSPLGFFIANGVALLLTGLAVAAAVALATKDALASAIGGLAYLLSPPVVENYYTLSKPEVPLALWLAVSLGGWAGARAQWETAPRRSRGLLAASALALLFAYLTKETAQAMLVVSVLCVIALRRLPGITRQPSAERIDRWCLAMNLAGTALFWAVRAAVGTAAIGAGGDSHHYAVSGQVLAASALRHLAWYVRDFPLLAPLLAFVWWRERHRLRADPWLVLVSVFWIIAWTLIMLPWHSTFEYYLLPAAIGVSALTGIGMASVVRSLGASRRAVRMVARTLLILTVVLAFLSLATALTNGRLQVAIDAANQRLVDFLATAVVRHGTVLVNLSDPNEYVAELALHLHVLKDRRDVKVDYLGGRDLREGDAILVAAPMMRNQPTPSIRMAISEVDATRSHAALSARLGRQADVVYRHTERFRLLMAQLHAPLCVLVPGSAARAPLFCGSRRFLDTRKFAYGWEVYRARAH